MRNRDPSGEEVLKQAKEIIDTASTELYRHFDVFIFDLLSTEYAQHSFVMPPMLTAYVEYCKEEEQSINIIEWIEQEKQRYIIPSPEVAEITAIGIMLHVLTRVQRVKGEQAKIEALSEADSLRNLFAALSKEKRALLAHIFSEQLNVIIRS